MHDIPYVSPSLHKASPDQNPAHRHGSVHIRRSVLFPESKAHSSPHRPERNGVHPVNLLSLFCRGLLHIVQETVHIRFLFFCSQQQIICHSHIKWRNKICRTYLSALSFSYCANFSSVRLLLLSRSVNVLICNLFACTFFYKVFQFTKLVCHILYIVFVLLHRHINSKDWYFIHFASFLNVKRFASQVRFVYKQCTLVSEVLSSAPPDKCLVITAKCLDMPVFLCLL